MAAAQQIVLPGMCLLHRTTPHRTHRTAPQRTAPHRTVPQRNATQEITKQAPNCNTPHRAASTATHRTTPFQTAPHHTTLYAMHRKYREAPKRTASTAQHLPHNEPQGTSTAPNHNAQRRLATTATHRKAPTPHQHQHCKALAPSDALLALTAPHIFYSHMMS